jgi:Ice-binding-like/Bacterial Ig-like domain
MSHTTVRTILVAACFVTFLTAGCGREQTNVAGPTIIATTPTNGALSVPITQAITATFSEAMNATTINTSTFTLNGPGGASVAGAVTYSGATATFTPAAPLAAGIPYTATVTTGAIAALGKALASSVAWTFTTRTIPAVIATNPLSGATNVPVNTKIIATFSEAMNSSTVTAPGTVTVAVAGANGAVVPGTVIYVAAADTARFAPSANFVASTQYTVTIDTSAQSAAGSALASRYQWSFTTASTPDVTAPTLTLTVPASAATGIPTNETITGTFSKVMDPATITAAGTFTVAVAGAGGAAVPGLVGYAGSIATFTPTTALASGTQFAVTITNAAQDLSGNALVAGVVPNPWTFSTGSGPSTTPPTITLSSPVSGALSVPLNSAVNATFSEAMDPVTVIAPNTFSLAVSGPGGPQIAGNVAYDPASDIATFTPAANLTANTQYTATVTNAATNLAGTALAAGVAPNPWTFTTGGAVGPVGPNLGAASTFGSFGGGAGITNQGINTVINGDIGTTGVSTSVTGFHDAGPGCTYTETGSNIGTVNGNIYTAPPPPTVACPSEGTTATFAIATQAASAANAAYLYLASQPAGPDPGAGQLGGLVLAPGTYTSSVGSFMITGLNLTLDAQGDANAVWVFQMATSLTVGGPGAPESVLLVNGAQAKNVFWQVGSAASIDGAGGGTMVGTIIASAGVTFSTAGNAAITTLDGRALALNASVTMVNTVVNVPAP